MSDTLSPNEAVKTYTAQLARGVLRLGSGEMLSRLFYIAIVVVLGHRYGIVILGAYALAISVSQYVAPVIDFGLRHVGARLIARFPRSASEILQQVQRRRILTALAVLPFVLLYASVARLSSDLKIFLFCFAAAAALYSFSLEWAAWGREQLLLVGLVKAVVPGSVLLGLLIAMVRGHLLSWLVVGNFVGYGFQAAIFWFWWNRHRREIPQPEQGSAEIADALLWRRTSVMGLAWLGNMAFNTSDMLILGTFSDAKQVGLYSASYRILNQALMGYYLLTNVLYPQFARLDLVQRRRMLRPQIFLLLFGIGAALALLIGFFRSPLLRIVFGHPFLAAAPLLLLLAWCVPLDFIVSYLSNAYFAWGMERSVLICAAIAAAVNIALNLATIPRYGAMAAAINTLIAYLVYLGSLAWAGKRVIDSQQGATVANP